MSIYLCDTNVISELARPQPNVGVLAWAATVVSISLSVITVEEIFYGLAWKPQPRIRAWFASFLETRCSLLPVTPNIAKHGGQLRGEMQARGKARSQADMLIAATAHLHQLTLVTRNGRDFDDCAISLLNPFRKTTYRNSSASRRSGSKGTGGWSGRQGRKFHAEVLRVLRLILKAAGNKVVARRPLSPLLSRLSQR